MDQDYLLWFHHQPWDFRVQSGRTLWQELAARYDRGVATVSDMRATWRTLAPFVDLQRFEAVSDMLEIQQEEAQWWRDASLAYWQDLNGLALPAGSAAPAMTLDEYRALEFPEAPGE